MPAIIVGTAIMAAQAVMRFMCSFCATVISERWASSALVSSSRCASIDSFNRTMWS